MHRGWWRIGRRVRADGLGNMETYAELALLEVGGSLDLQHVLVFLVQILPP